MESCCYYSRHKIQKTVQNIAITKKEKQWIWHIPEVFPEKVIDFTNKPSMWHFFLKNVFVDDGDIKLVTNRLKGNTYFTASGGNFVRSFNFFKKMNYTILFSPFWLCLIDLITSKSYNFLQKIYETPFCMRCRI